MHLLLHIDLKLYTSEIEGSTNGQWRWRWRWRCRPLPAFSLHPLLFNVAEAISSLLLSCAMFVLPSLSFNAHLDVVFLLGIDPFTLLPLQKGVRGQRFVILNVRCELEGSKGIFQSECRTTSSSSADDRSISTYKWCAALGSIGLLDMAYLTYLKLTDSDVFFPMGEGSILTSEFSIFALTFGLFFITIKDFGSEKIKKMLASQLCTSLAIIAVCTSYPVLPSLAVTEMPYVKTEITGESSPLALSLARHLHSIGAKLYGAFWCSHCVHQKQMFGSEAAKLLDYVECYPDGIKAGTRMAEACSNIDLQAFPSWVINGEVLSGEKKFPELAQLSGMKLENLSE